MDDATPSTPQPEPAPEPKKQDGRKNNGAHYFEHPKKPKQVNGEKLIPQAINAVLSGKSLNRVTSPLSFDGKRYLTHALKMDVDQWRSEFATKLRAASDQLLEKTVEELELIPPGQRAFALSVFIDKLQALEGKNALANAGSVNVQINNYGSLSKEDLVKKLQGVELPVQDVEAKE